MYMYWVIGINTNRVYAKYTTQKEAKLYADNEYCLESLKVKKIFTKS